MEFRSDGLLRGSRDNRVKQMSAMKKAEWGPDTILELYIGLLDHAEGVRAEAMMTLQRLAKEHPAPVPVTPIKMMAQFMHTFTVASGVATDTVIFLSRLGTPEASDELVAILESGCGNNNQFQDWVAEVQKTRKIEVLQRVRLEKLSQNRTRIVKRALDSLDSCQQGA